MGFFVPEVSQFRLDDFGGQQDIRKNRRLTLSSGPLLQQARQGFGEIQLI